MGVCVHMRHARSENERPRRTAAARLEGRCGETAEIHQPESVVVTISAASGGDLGVAGGGGCGAWVWVMGTPGGLCTVARVVSIARFTHGRRGPGVRGQ
eukprot:3114269-Prymnesium_polylepis.1